MELVITNTSHKAQRFEEALHAYFKVGDVEQVRIRGLDGVSYSDKADQDRLKVQRGDIAIASETDRAYLETDGAVELADPVLGRSIRVEKVNSSTTVVWNPWVERAKALPDLGDDEWKQMLCIEAANAGDAAVSLPSGGQHTMRATITVTA
jgi:glucose-6-phosphate 1-epimerase